MNFQEFRISLKNYPVFSTIEIEKLHPTFDFKNLVNWQKKNFIQKIRNSWYCFTENNITTDSLFFTSNHIYKHSYISLESALSYYGFIPEGVFKITAVSTLKTQEFDTPIGIFSYQNVKSELFFGYKMLPFGNFQYKMAEPEKAIIDYLYLHPYINSLEHFEELRFNLIEIKQSINFDILENYTTFINRDALTKRVNIFIKFVQNAEFITNPTGLSV